MKNRSRGLDSETALNLKNFFAVARPFLANLSVTAPHINVLQPDRLRNLLTEVSALLALSHSAGLFINPWVVSGLKRKEIRNASALAGLWSLSQGGETSVKFLSAFLDRLLPANGQAFPCIAELRRGYRLSLEDCPLGEKTERVDLIIEGKNFLIGIEVKIDARLGPEQLERYIKTIERRANHGGQKPYVILLAPFPPNLKDVTHARWKDVERAARSALPRKTADYQYSDRLIESFAVHIHSF